MGRLPTIVALSLILGCAGAAAAAWPGCFSCSPSAAVTDGVVLARGGGMGGGGGIRCGPCGGGMGGLGSGMGGSESGMGGFGGGMGGSGSGMGGGAGGLGGSNFFRAVPQADCPGDRRKTDPQSLLCGDSQ